MSWHLYINKDRLTEQPTQSRRWVRHFYFALVMLLASTSRGSALDDDFKAQQLFRNVLEQVQQNYVSPVQAQPLVETAIGAMLATLDPESGYLAAGARLPSASFLAGDLPELGFNLSFEPQALIVVSVADNSPADRLGFQTGDRILTVNNSPIQESSLYQAMNNLRQSILAGPITLLVQRNERQVPMIVKIAKSTNPSINSRIGLKMVNFALAEEAARKPATAASAQSSIDKNSLAAAANSSSTGSQIAPIAVVRIPRFSDSTATELEAVLKQASTEAASVATKGSVSPASGGQFSGLILDLRSNPGGSTEGAIAASNLFIKSGLMTSLVPRNDLKPLETSGASPATVSGNATAINQIMEYNANSAKASSLVSKTLPIVILLDRGSSGATEIFAAALKDNHRAVIVGNRSFGQASFHKLIPLSNGGNLFLMVAKWRRPNGQMINDGGIVPDIVVSNPIPPLQGIEFGKPKDSSTNAPNTNSLPPEDSQMLRGLDAIRSMVVYANLMGGKK
ncbi:MAG: S41 family peptidase [Candidatus Pacebacteria bacterium]|nr:S41 family peptidase [Candidatus Paceibacterota bacterium]